jgi:hypothetical protein
MHWVVYFDDGKVAMFIMTDEPTDVQCPARESLRNSYHSPSGHEGTLPSGWIGLGLEMLTEKSLSAIGPRNARNYTKTLCCHFHFVSSRAFCGQTRMIIGCHDPF